MALFGRAVGLQDLSLDIITSILRLLTPEEVLYARLISRYVDSVVLDNIRYVIPSTDQMRLNDSLLSKVLYRRVPCVEGEVNDNNAVRLVTQLTSLASKIDHSADNSKHHRKTVCDALTVSKGRQWVLDNLGRPAVDSCSGDYTMVLAAWLGLEGVVRACFADGSSADPQLEHLGSGLYAAAFNNNESLLRLLLRQGLDPQRREGFYGDALQPAAYRGPNEAVRILVRQTIYAKLLNCGGYDPLEEYGPFGSSLGAAAAAGQEESVRILLAWLSNESMLRNQRSLSQTPLFLAVKNGRVGVVRLLLNSELFDYVSAGPDGYTPLIAAVAHNQEPIVRLLLESDVFRELDLLTITAEDDNVPGPVKMAAERGLLQILELLLRYTDFADEEWLELLVIIVELHTDVMESLVERRSFREQVPVRLRIGLLWWAICSGKVRITQLFCEVPDARLYREYQCANNEDVLHTAAWYDRPEAVATLLQRNETDPNVRGKSGQTPLMIAAERNSVGCIDALLRDTRTNRDARDEEGVTALMYATSIECLPSLQLLRSCDPNVRDDMDRTALEWAMSNRNPRAIKNLLRRDDLDLSMAFDTALNERNLEVTKSILARDDFNPNTNDSLYLAIENDTRVVDLLLARSDIDPNKFVSGDTPLLLAIQEDDTEVVKSLLARKDVDPNLGVGDYSVPLETAVHYGNRQMIELLLSREDIDVNQGAWPSWLEALLCCKMEIVSLILSDHRCKINLRNKEGTRALGMSAEIGDVEIMRQLYSKDSTFDVNNHRINNGDTVLLRAAGYGRESAVQYLLDMGADVNALNDFGQTPLHAASYNGHEKVVKLLIDNGANANLVDKEGRTPYAAAIRAVNELRNGRSAAPNARMAQ